MSYIEQLRKSRQKPQVAFQEFALATRKYPSYLFCFFEGKDNAYYSPRIKRFTKNYHPIKCGGREKVLAVYQLITNRKEYDGYKKAFFIDRDFNAPLPPTQPPIFETPCYSIENLYVSIEVFKEILTNEFHLSAVSDAVFDQCVALFKARQQEFHQAVTLFNAWYACVIAIKQKTKKVVQVQLKDKLPKKWVTFSLQAITSNYHLSTIQKLFPDAPAIKSEDLAAQIAFFATCDCCKAFRGKYEMQFLITFIRLILQDAQKTNVLIKEKINFAFGDASSLNHENALNIFEGYAETPKSLIDYLKIATNN